MMMMIRYTAGESYSVVALVVVVLVVVVFVVVAIKYIAEELKEDPSRACCRRNQMSIVIKYAVEEGE
jgi:biopolymer transport protein ExbD